jgi:diguanylate cyclase (GGDEF)-like protein
VTIHILVVDDDTAITDSMCEFVEAAGYQSFAASNADEAIRVLEKNTIHIVITDILMSGMNGLELTDQIKKNYKVDVIVMTGYSADYSYEEAISKGASDFVFKPIRFEELLLRLKRVLNERKLSEERAEMMKKLNRLATTDGLTRLYNSRSFYNHLESEADRSARYKRPLSLLFLDIDHFKKFNDTYGHLEGDKVLMRIGEVIMSCLRGLDTAYRYGGEEFTIILPETIGTEAGTVANRIRKAIEEEKFMAESGNPVTITISIGVTQFNPNEEMSSFIQRSDRAMYMSKQNGRNRITTLLNGDTQVPSSE